MGIAVLESRFSDNRILRSSLSLTALPPDLGHSLEYWRTIAHDDLSQPTWRDIDMMLFPSRLLPSILVYDVADPIEQSRYRYWGSNVTRIYGADYSGKTLSSLPFKHVVEGIAKELKSVCDIKAPVGHILQFFSPKGVQQNQCILRLPVFDTPGTVTKIVVLIDTSVEAMRAFHAAIGTPKPFA